jgi:uncharacterized protein involved in tolerance to divalent cations
MHPPIHLVFTTCGSKDDAERLGRRLVEERLAACATLIPGAVSFYTWKSEPRRDEEVLLLLKTTGPHVAIAGGRLRGSMYGVSSGRLGCRGLRPGAVSRSGDRRSAGMNLLVLGIETCATTRPRP